MTHILPDRKSIQSLQIHLTVIDQGTNTHVTENSVRCPGIVHRLAIKTDVVNRVQKVAPDPVRTIDAANIAVDPGPNQQINLAGTNTIEDDAVTLILKIVIAVHRENEQVEAEVAVVGMGRREEINPTKTTRLEEREKITNKCLHRKTGTARRWSVGQTINLMKTIDPVHRTHSDAINATRVMTAMEGISMMVAVKEVVDHDAV